jgi:methionyl-tRNA formyltransferase
MGATAPLRLAFMGTPDFAVPVLDALVAAGHVVAAVYSQPPRPTGRGHRTQPSPVQARAEALGIPVRHPVSLKDEAEQASFAGLDLDAAIVAAYGLILPKAILAAPRLGCINIHASLLPRWRGAAPIQRALLAGDAETGVTIMQMEAGLDTGPMLLREAVAIGPGTTAQSLHDALSALGARLIGPALDGIVSGDITAQPQPMDGITYASKLSRDEGELDWRDDAGLNERKVRALNPFPGTWFELDSERIKILAASAEPIASGAAPGTVIDDDLGIACGQGVFRPTILQRPGRGPVERRAFLNGTPVARQRLLSCPATS